MISDARITEKMINEEEELRTEIQKLKRQAEACERSLE